jgi:hypothetical protein
MKLTKAATWLLSLYDKKIRVLLLPILAHGGKQALSMIAVRSVAFERSGIWEI